MFSDKLTNQHEKPTKEMLCLKCIELDKPWENHKSKNLLSSNYEATKYQKTLISNHYLPKQAKTKKMTRVLIALAK